MNPVSPMRAAELDLTVCDREPIHLCGSIQPHGVLFVLGVDDLVVLQVSANVAELLGKPVEQVLGQDLDQALTPEAGRQLRQRLHGASFTNSSLYLRSVTLPAQGGEQRFHATVHATDGGLILELELAGPGEELSFQDLHALIRVTVNRLERIGTVAELAQVAAEEVRRLTGFDRVLIYQFEKSWNGVVVAEDRNEALPSYLDLRFPASDIPQQARELYRVNRLRLIADASYTPVPLVPLLHPRTGQPVDLSFATLRSVSPVHLEYMRNMGTAASLSISILRDGHLWGLISCHHSTPRVAPLEIRTACDYLGQVLSLQLTAKEHQADYEQRMQLQIVHSRLLAALAREDSFIEGLQHQSADLLALTAAHGAALLHKGQKVLLGRTPTQEQIEGLVSWLSESVREEVFATDALAEVFPDAEAYRDQASGLLAVSISRFHQSYILWFRPEIIQTVRWGGDPRKPVERNGTRDELHPRRSFETWKETVHLHSLPWNKNERELARELRSAVVGIVLRKAEELAQLNAELERSNKELEAFSYSVSHDLRAPLRHIMGYSELLSESEQDRLTEAGRRYLHTLTGAARLAGELVDHLLAFSRIGRTTLELSRLDMSQLVAEARVEVMTEAQGRLVQWKVHPLPAVSGDLIMIRLVLRNLLENALKYTRPRPEAVIEVGCQEGENETVFFVRDNGVGFDMAYARKLFGVFQRLHRIEEFEGTGIGLATVRRIVARHGGRTWAEGVVDQGATVYFSLPHAAPGEPEHAQADPAGGRQPQ